MTDFNNLRESIIKAVKSNSAWRIDRAIDDIWQDGRWHGFEDGYDKASSSSQPPAKDIVART